MSLVAAHVVPPGLLKPRARLRITAPVTCRRVWSAQTRAGRYGLDAFPLALRSKAAKLTTGRYPSATRPLSELACYPSVHRNDLSRIQSPISLINDSLADELDELLAKSIVEIVVVPDVMPVHALAPITKHATGLLSLSFALAALIVFCLLLVELALGVSELRVSF